MELDPRDCLNWSTKQNEWTGYLSHFHVNDHDFAIKYDSRVSTFCYCNEIQEHIIHYKR
jgi:hypothetical protein